MHRIIYNTIWDREHPKIIGPLVISTVTKIIVIMIVAIIEQPCLNPPAAGEQIRERGKLEGRTLSCGFLD